MSELAVSSVLAVVAALLFTAAAVLQQQVTRAAALAAPQRWQWLPAAGALLAVLRNPIWLCGLAANVLGYVAHATALHHGSITVVQALLTVQLLLAMPFAAARAGAAPLARDWFGALAICAGIAVLVVARGRVPQVAGDHGEVAVTSAAALAAITLLVLAGGLAHGRSSPRTALIGVAAGIGFSQTAALTVVVADRLAVAGVWGAAVSWPLYALGASGLIAAVLAQHAFASGSLPTALAAMTVTDPVASWLWGALLFDAAPPITVAALAALGLSASLITAGVLLLAFSPTMFEPAGADPLARSGVH
jgi:hypothetical protein